MQFSTFISAFVVFGANGLVASTGSLSRTDGLPAGTKLVPMQWTGPITPGGPNHTIDGTAGSIHREIMKRNPDFNNINNTDSHSNTTRARVTAAVDKRMDWYAEEAKTNKIMCRAPPGSLGAEIPATLRNLDYLRAISGECRVAGKACTQVACQFNSAITFCNDNEGDFFWRCADLAEWAHDVGQNCLIGAEWWGQKFSNKNFNVIVGRSYC